MILSPLSKTGMYAGHLFYSFFIGFMQILTVLVMFHYFLDYDLGHRFGMMDGIEAAKVIQSRWSSLPVPWLILFKLYTAGY